MIIGSDGPAVVISAETAHYLEVACRLTDHRVRMRGLNPRIGQELLDIRNAAMSFDPRALPGRKEVGAGSAEVAQDLEQWLTPMVVADQLGMTDRGVRLACAQGRIEAELVGGKWRISPQAFQNYRAARAA